MDTLYQYALVIRYFLEQGGEVLMLLLIVSFFLWYLILERKYYLFHRYKKDSANLLGQWQVVDNKASWCAEQIKKSILSQIRIKADRNIAMIKLIVNIAPLIGLLGTVLGMISVFDVMATTGSSNARGMAAGVSKATIPTMAGMVVSLFGLVFSVHLQRGANKIVALLDEKINKE